MPVVSTDGRSGSRCTVTWLPNFLGWIEFLRDGPLENLWGGGGAGEVQKNSRKGKLNDSGTVSSFLQRNKFRYQVQNHKAVLYESSRDYVTEIRA